MATQLFANNASSTIAAGITNSATSLTLATGQGALFPSPTGGDWFLLTLTQATQESSWEIVKVTARSTDTLTIVRAQESTTGAIWATGSKVEARLTSGSLVAAVTGGQNGLLLGSDKTKLDATSGTNSGDNASNSSSAPAAANPIGLQTCWVPVGAMIARTTNGPSYGTVETATNKVMIRTLDFDPTTQQYAQFGILMPKSWNEGSITFLAEWSHAATSTNFGVAWSLAAVAFGDNVAMDAARGTAVVVTDTGGTTRNSYKTAVSSAMTVAGAPTANNWVVFEVSRVVADASDTMAINAGLHGIQLFYTTDAATDV